MKTRWQDRLSFCITCFAFLAAESGALAGDNPNDQVVFPEGSSFGTIPFEGSSEAEGFTGFIDLEDSTSVTINEMPLVDWSETSAGFQDRALLYAQGIVATKIQETVIGGMNAVRISGTQLFHGRQIPKCILLVKGEHQIGLFAAQIPEESRINDDACALIRGISERPELSIESQLAALPFELSDLGGLRVLRVLGGSGVLLTRGPLDVVKSVEQPVMIVTSSLAPSAQGWDRMEFSKQLLLSLPLYSVEKTLQETQASIDDSAAIEMIVNVRHLESQQAARLVQWTVFAHDSGYTRMIGIARPDQWEESIARFETVRDGLAVPIG